MTIDIKIEMLSPLHLGSGAGSVTVDSDIIHDDVGMPIFPAKRLKGLLYESAIEVTEMAELSGRDFVTRGTVEELFHHGASAVEFICHNLTACDAATHDYLKYVLVTYPDITASDVFAEHTSIRYATRIDRATGTAADTSLRNIRVLDRHVTFRGSIELVGAEPRHVEALVLAAQNLHYVGGKRNRGLGRVRCTIANQKKLVESALGEAK